MDRRLKISFGCAWLWCFFFFFDESLSSLNIRFHVAPLGLVSTGRSFSPNGMKAMESGSVFRVDGAIFVRTRGGWMSPNQTPSRSSFVCIPSELFRISRGHSCPFGLEWFDKPQLGG